MKSSKKAPKAPKTPPKLSDPVSAPLADNEHEAADRLGSILALRLHLAAGAIPCGPYAMYLRCVDSLADVAKAFGVSERTAANWKAKGMPVADDGRYALESIRWWRLDQPDPPHSLYRGLPGHNLPPHDARGDLARALLRWLRVELIEAGRRVIDDFVQLSKSIDQPDEAAVRDLLTATTAHHLEWFRLTDDAIEKLVSDCWELV